MKTNSNFQRDKTTFDILRMLRRSDIGRGGLTFYVVKNIDGLWAYQVCHMPKKCSELTFKAVFERDDWFITLFEHEARKLVDFLNNVNEVPETYPFKLCTGMMCDPYMREIILDIIECNHNGITDFWYKTEESRIDINIFDGSYCGEDVQVNIYPIVNGKTDVDNPIGTAALIKGTL
ncbi:TPA: hypothetical protein ACPDSY_001260 [Pasteurella multocida]